MFGKSKNELTPPANGRNPRAVEVLRVWAEPGSAQQLVLQTTWKDRCLGSASRRCGPSRSKSLCYGKRV